MPLYRAYFETLYVSTQPDRLGRTGQTYGRRHDIVLEAANIKVAAEDALRFIRNRQDGEKKMYDSMTDDADWIANYEAYWGELGALRVVPWAPYVVGEDGNVGDAPDFAGRGMFEWKCDFPFPIEKEISIIRVKD